MSGISKIHLCYRSLRVDMHYWSGIFGDADLEHPAHSEPREACASTTRGDRIVSDLERETRDRRFETRTK